MVGGSMLEVIGELTADPSARAALQEDPDGFLLDRGLDGFTVEDLRDAIDLSADALPVEVAAHLTGPDAPSALPGESDHEAVLRLLDHAAESPLPEESGLEGDEGAEGVDDLDFGTGSADAVDDVAGAEVEQGVDPDGEGHEDEAEATAEVDLSSDAELDALVGFEGEEDVEGAGTPEPDDGGVQSEEVPDRWDDGQQDEGSLDPQELGDDLGDLPGV